MTSFPHSICTTNSKEEITYPSPPHCPYNGAPAAAVAEVVAALEVLVLFMIVDNVVGDVPTVEVA